MPSIFSVPSIFSMPSIVGLPSIVGIPRVFAGSAALFRGEDIAAMMIEFYLPGRSA
jgi:hypothetical protein